MATSTGKTIGLILLVVLILIIVFRMTPFIFAPLGIFPGVFHVVKTPNFSSISYNPYHIFKMTSVSLLTLALLVLWILVIVWVYRDAERRGMNGVLWALLVFIGNLIGLLIYLIVRSDAASPAKEIQPPQECPSCKEYIASSFVFCPHCGERLLPVCPECQKPVEKDWHVCPHCGGKLTKESKD